MGFYNINLNKIMDEKTNLLTNTYATILKPLYTNTIQ